MKTVTITKNLYNYDELPEDVKEKVIQNLYDINVDYEWWDYDGHTGFTLKELQRMRLVNASNLPCDLLKFKEMYFSLDRDYYIQFVDADFTDDELARRFLRVPKKLWNQVTWNIIDQPGRNGNTRLEYEANFDYSDYSAYAHQKEFTSKQIEILDRACEIFSDKISEALSNLSDEWDYRTSRKAIEETIEANEYTFNLDGHIDNG